MKTVEDVVGEMLRAGMVDGDPPGVAFVVPGQAIEVTDVEETGRGIVVDMKRMAVVANGDRAFSARLGNTTVGLINEKIPVGCVVYVDDGFVTAVEVCTFGSDWPSTIEAFRVLTDAEVDSLEWPEF